MEYIKASQAAEQWGLSARRIRKLCEDGKIPGATKQGRLYYIPASANKPADGRKTRHSQVPEAYSALFAAIDQLKSQLDERRPFTAGELKRMQEEFLVE